jgi:putative Mg2+ transporter-C (MgtC) family protein
MTDLDVLRALLKLTLAVVFGGLVGWQREARDRPAGLRTHVLVCVGSAVYTLASLSFSGPTSDPGRVAAQVATGMGFLGAGTIIRHGNVVRGLTTAASLWAVAAIGICVAIGGEGYWIAGLATAVVLLTLTVLRSAEQKLLAHSRVAHLTVRLMGGPTRMREVEQLMTAQGAIIESTEVSEVGPGDIHQMELRVLLAERGCDLGSLGSALTGLDGFVSMRCE